MKKETYFLKNQVDPYLIETCEPLIVWTISVGSDILALPEFVLLIEQEYSIN
jgi:hypothetical protein